MIVLLIASCTRWLQVHFNQRPVRGITRLMNLLHRIFKPVQATIQFADGFTMRLDSGYGSQRSLMFYGTYQPALSWMIRQVVPRGGYCLDIGANLGYYTLLMASLSGKEGRVASFEANPNLQARLEQSRLDNHFEQVQILHRAVSDELTTATFYVASDIGKSSLLADQVANLAEKVTVDTITIDSFMQQAQWERLDAIKLDIEGYDVQALCGAQQTLAQFRPFIVFEYHRTTPTNYVAQLRNLLVKLDYRLEYLLLDGSRGAFTWDVPIALEHIDVLCFPNQH